VRARLLATIPSLLPSGGLGAPGIVGRPGRRVLAQGGEDALVVCTLDDAFRTVPEPHVRFPAPWPTRRSSWALAPDAGTAVFAGVHALHAVDTSGNMRWQLRHGCWDDACQQMHQSYDEYADREDHRYAKHGSAAFSADGRLLWAHVRGRHTDGEWDPDVIEEWLVLDAETGRVLAGANAKTVAEGSTHIPHPTDASQMGLSIGEGQDGAPVRWGRWDGRSLDVAYIADDMALIDASPAGRLLMTVAHNQSTLAIRPIYGVSDPARVVVESAAARSRHPDMDSADDESEPESAAFWDWAGGFVNETAVIASTQESDSEWGEGRHWLVDARGTRPVAQVTYPFTVPAEPVGLGDGTWYTYSESDNALHVWTLPDA
jgi:hypothetical protein